MWASIATVLLSAALGTTAMLPLLQGFAERGHLGLARHPDFARNGRVVVSHSAKLRDGAPPGWNHTRRLSEYAVAIDDPTRVLSVARDAAGELHVPPNDELGPFGTTGKVHRLVPR
jgi:hypothetical protein